MEQRFDQRFPDVENMHRGFRERPCFICRMAAEQIRLPGNVVYEGERDLMFLDGYPRAYGYTRVATRGRREQVAADFALEEYLRLQSLVYRVAGAMREEVGAGRVYLYSFGSNQGNARVHWHVVPLPPGVSHGEQQGEWGAWNREVLKIPRQEMSALAARIGRRL